MKILKWFLIVIGALIVLLLILVGTIYYMFTRPIPLAKEITPVPISQEAAVRLEQKIDALEQEIETARQKGEVKPVKLEVTPEEATSWAKDKIDKAIAEGQIDLPLTIKNIQINFSSGSVVVKAMASGTLYGITATVGGKALVDIKEGSLWYRIEEIYLGGLPGFVKDQLMSYLPESGEGTIQLVDLPVELQDIHIENGKLIVNGMTTGK